jgi:hypothetical protein
MAKKTATASMIYLKMRMVKSKQPAQILLMECGNPAVEQKEKTLYLDHEASTDFFSAQAAVQNGPYQFQIIS